jgi:hypothetical protein
LDGEVENQYEENISIFDKNHLEEVMEEINHL